MAELVALIDCGAGNLQSVRNALRTVGADVRIAHDAAQLRAADRIVLPGVGSFRACMEGLRHSGMVQAMEERVLVDGMPFLGICVGMQLLANHGLEHGKTAGLGWIAGEVGRIEPSTAIVKVPHMGWNMITPSLAELHHPVVESGEAYFLHSYQFVADDVGNILAVTDHGGPITAAVGRDNILGVQFHPEKSQHYGLNLLRKFLDWNP